MTFIVYILAPSNSQPIEYMVLQSVNGKVGILFLSCIFHLELLYCFQFK